ncbi:MAG: carbohydrate-binding domain-containing protein [Oscillospiraceae bacterium]|nr:carbohydrate-binding domain-containing protein [Oscillospiraceae bacterium]
MKKDLWKKSLALLLAACVCGAALAGCAAEGPGGTQPPAAEGTAASGSEAYADAVTVSLSDEDITVDGEPAESEPAAVFLSRDIIYYEDRDTYESGNAYGEGEAWERHTAAEAASHTVVNITAPGTYRISGKLSAGQLRVDLGEEAFTDPSAVVTLVLDGADITCTVAPAILFLNVYECDNAWSVESARSTVDTSAAGANLILAGGSTNVISGSHVARIYKDSGEEKKLWKQDGAIYSYMSMNVDGGGTLELFADNEGLDTELHLTVNGGDLNIRSDNDGINTNEDGVSVTTINGGAVHIIAGLGAEGDGIDSNGWLVINGGTVVASANPAADAGLDSDMGSYVNGGTVVALDSAMDWAESDSAQVTMNLQFAGYKDSGDAIVVTREGAVVFAYDPSADEVLGENTRRYMGAIVSDPGFAVGDAYQVFIGGEVTGSETGGIYDPVSVTDHTGGVLQCYTGTDVMLRPGTGGFGGQRPGGEWQEGEPPEGFDPENMPERPAGEFPENFDPENAPQGGFGGKDGFGMGGQRPGSEPPEGFDPENMPERPAGEFPENFDPENVPAVPEGGFGGMTGEDGDVQTVFYMQDKVNAFSGLSNAA